MKTLSLLMSSAIAAVSPTRVLAQLYNGNGIQSGLNEAGNLGLARGNPFLVLLSVVRTILSFMGLVAVCTIVIAGIYMIISLGNDEQYEKGKKIIKYTLIGLIVILFSRMIVGLVTNYLYSVAR